MVSLVDAQVAMYSAVTVLAQAEPEPPQGPEFGKASPIGIPVVLLLLIATVLLVWNMNSRIKRLPESFDTHNPEADQLADEGTDRSAVAGSESELRGQDEANATSADVSSLPENRSRSEADPHPARPDDEAEDPR